MEDLIKLCRYYKGEKECPEKLNKEGYGTIWFYEQIWVQNPDFRDETDDIDNINFYGYKHAGLIDFNVGDGVPVSLKALLFNRYCHWSGYGDPIIGFKRWYFEFYLK